MNSKLSIAIPTYNRPEILKENLLIMLPYLIEFQIPVYISDDSTNDFTNQMILELKSKYNKIYYQKNKPSFGHDKNCISTLSLPKEDYVWYLGDSKYINKEGIKTIVDLIEKNKFSAIVVSDKSRDISLPSKNI